MLEAQTFQELRTHVERTAQLAICRWKWFEQVDALIRERPEIVDKVSRAFFESYQHLLLDSLILDLSRLTDPADRGKYENLSVRRMLQVLPSQFTPEERRRIEEKTERLLARVHAAREHRNKRVAHSDLATAISNRLGWIRKEDIRAALDLLAEILNEISHRVDRSTTDYFSVFALDGGLDSVVWHLLHGMRRLEERKAANQDVRDVQ